MKRGRHNVHGRRGGRGARPWLLIPKVLAVGGFTGSLASAWVLTLAMDHRGGEQWQALLEAVGLVISRVMVPCAVTALACGAGLAAMHWSALVRQRWLQVKAVVLVIGLPACHFWAHGVYAWLEEELTHGGSPEGPVGTLEMLQVALAVGLAVVVLLVWLGRHKPRLGRRPGRT